MKNIMLAIASLTLVSAAVYAQNGPVQINQASVAEFATSYASQGFPFTITQPGSYQLTSNLRVPAGLDGIDIVSNNVTLDLNGFTISGTGTCTGAGASITCSGLVGTPIGIFNSSVSNNVNVTVRNGSVVGFADGMALAGQGNLVEDVHASSNTASGIIIYNGVARRNTANLNKGVGIGAFSSTVTENVANSNGEVGLATSSGGVYGSNTFFGNGSAVDNGGSVSQNNNACNAAAC